MQTSVMDWLASDQAREIFEAARAAGPPSDDQQPAEDAPGELPAHAGPDETAEATTAESGHPGHHALDHPATPWYFSTPMLGLYALLITSVIAPVVYQRARKKPKPPKPSPPAPTE